VFHGFGQAKFSYDGSILGTVPIYTTASAASKIDARIKSGQNRLKNNHLASLI